MNEKDIARMEELGKILNPPKAEVSETEIKLAHSIATLNDLLWDDLYGMMIYLKYLRNPEDKDVEGWIKLGSAERLKQDAYYIVDKLYKQIYDHTSESAEDDSERAYPNRLNPNFKYVVESLDDMHCGDCTSHSSSCMRCHAEAAFSIPYTATWGKSDGWKLISEYFSLNDQYNKEQGK